MKITLLFIFLTFFTLQAETSYSQRKNVTLDFKDVTVEKVLNTIEASSDFNFIYKTEDVDLLRIVSIKAKKEQIKDVLTRIFKNSGTTFNIIEEQIFLLKDRHFLKNSENDNSEQLYQQSISGTITDETGNTFPGVYVVIKGTSKGTISDLDGRYTLQSKPQDTLIFSHIGYRTIERAVGLQELLNLQMKPSTDQLSEVVLTGFFERKAESYTGSSVTVTSEELRKKANTNIFQAIQNIDPSIVLMDNFSMGSNPNSLPNMQIRGQSTFPSDDLSMGGDLKGNYLRDPNQPLFILNGFEASVEQIYDLDLNRIEKLSILKDAASKALYGSRAANGVVVVETKQLSSGEALISYNASLDLEVPDLSSYDLTNSLEKLEAERIDGYYLPNQDDIESQVELQQLYNFRRRLALDGLDTDWMAKPLHTGVGQRHSVGVELGSNDLRVQGNLTYRNREGAMRESNRENIDGSITAMYRVKNFMFRNIMRVNKNTSNESPYGEFSQYTRMNPYWRAENPDGSIPYFAEVGPSGIEYPNPLYNTTLNVVDEQQYFNFTNNFYIEWRFKPEFRLTARVGLDVQKSSADEFYPASHTMFNGYRGEEELLRRGTYQVNNGERSYVYSDINLQYNKTIKKNVFFGNIGFNIREEKFSEIIHRTEGFPSSRMEDIIFARDYALDSRPTGIDGLTRDLGFLGVGSYIYDNRFLSDITIRTSASSQFGADKRWATFWSAGLGWNFHNEKFMENSGFDQLKVRATVGNTGNQNFNTNESIATYSYFLDRRYQGFPGSAVQNMANSLLQWESKMDYNAGVDAKFKFATLRFDYYESYTENLITDITIPYSTGFNSVAQNLGKVKNQGIEVDLNLNLWSRGRNFFAINAGLATNTNEIVELSDAMRSYNEAMEEQAASLGRSEPVLRYEDGMSMNTIWAVPSLGIDPATGDEIYQDAEGNVTYEWDAANLVAAGNSNAKYRGVFGFSGEYNGFGISVTGRYLTGAQLYNQTLVDRVENVDMNYNVDRRVLTGRWLYPGQEARFKRLGTYSVDTDGDGVLDETNNRRTRATTRFVQDRSELDIAAVNVYYEFNKSILEALHLQRLRLSFNMNEIATFSSIKIERGLDYPFARNLSFSLTANL